MHGRASARLSCTWVPFFSRYVIGEGTSSCTDSCADPDCVITCQEPASFSTAFQPPRDSQLLLRRALRGLHGPTGRILCGERGSLQSPSLLTTATADPNNSLCRAARLNRFFCWHFVGTRGDQTTLQSKVWSGQQRKLPNRSIQIQGHNRASVPVQNTCNVHVPLYFWEHALDVDRPAGLIAIRQARQHRITGRPTVPTAKA
jgi:hypothetical protein